MITYPKDKLPHNHVALCNWDEMLFVVNEHNLRVRADDGYESKREGQAEFFGTATLKAALDLARDGWPEGLAMIHAGLAVNLAPVHGTPRVRYDVAGAFPNVPRYVAGDMFHMRDKGEEFNHKPVVTILVPAAVSAIVTVKQRLNQGMALVRMIDTLENSGRRCEVLLYDRAGNSRDPRTCNHWYETRVIVKEASQPLDLDRLAFASMHMAQSRRMGFALCEIFFNHKQWESYGAPIFLDKEMVPDAVIVPPIHATWAKHYNTPETAFELIKKAVKDFGVEIED